VAGQQAVVDGAPVEREAHVRAAVLDRPRPLAVPEHHDGQVTGLAHELTRPPELVGGPQGDGVAIHGPDCKTSTVVEVNGSRRP
jgi:hypothetical protein